MTRNPYSELCALTEALQERAAARLRGLRDEEARLRAELARLDAQDRDARAMPQLALRGVREIGADIAWQSWVEGRRMLLRDQLAQVLARKELALPAQRRAFGRLEAARALRNRAQAEARDGQARRRADLLNDLGVMLRGRARTGDGPDQVS